MHSLDSGFHSLDSGFQIGCGFRIPENWSRIRIPPMFGFWIPLSGFRIAKLLKVGFRIAGLPYMGLKEHVNLTQLRFPVSRAHTKRS
jgi:hypothetical protein